MVPIVKSAECLTKFETLFRNCFAFACRFQLWLTSTAANFAPHPGTQTSPASDQRFRLGRLATALRPLAAVESDHGTKLANIAVRPTRRQARRQKAADFTAHAKQCDTRRAIQAAQLPGERARLVYAAEISGDVEEKSLEAEARLEEVAQSELFTAETDIVRFSQVLRLTYSVYYSRTVFQSLRSPQSCQLPTFRIHGVS